MQSKKIHIDCILKWLLVVNPLKLEKQKLNILLKISVLTVLSKGDTIHYIVLSFPVYSAELVEIKVQWEDEDGSLLVFDAFTRKCDLLDHQLPAIAKILFSYDNAFIIEVRYIFE